MKKIKNKALKRYCTGCGLCKSLNKARLGVNEKGFYIPIEGDEEFLKKICPCSAKKAENLDITKIWGKSYGTYFGWAYNKVIRHKSSSGGTLTAIACYLLETKKVDYIIQIGADDKNPTMTKIVFSSTVKQVIQNSGSRYSISHPLERINDLNLKKKYAIIGRPCDITALKNYANINSDINNSILYYFSFFCMGIPSIYAQKKLLKKLNCIDIKSLTYRGNGWPGKTIAVDKNGNESKIDYLNSWGEILGRDLMPYCKFCIDGIGEEADISCGDAWYLNEKNEPDFNEHDGRNIIFSRTERGNLLLKELQSEKVLKIDKVDNYYAYLNAIQKSQYDRRQFMLARIMALKTLFQPAPNYSYKMMKYYSKESSFLNLLKSYLGTLKRIIKHKI